MRITVIEYHDNDGVFNLHKAFHGYKSYLIEDALIEAFSQSKAESAGLPLISIDMYDEDGEHEDGDVFVSVEKAVKWWKNYFES